MNGLSAYSEMINAHFDRKADDNVLGQVILKAKASEG